MPKYRRTSAATVLALAGLAAHPAQADAATEATASFAGTITSTMSVNNGTNTGSIAAGTAYTGSVTYSTTPSSGPAAYGGGTRTTYSFSDLTFTIGPSSAHSGPGRIDVFDDLTTATGYPDGDSVYVNFGGAAPDGLLAGAAFNWMGLAMLDPSGAAVTGGQLPAALDSSAFTTRFSEFNYGTRGTPWGAGNTSTIQGLTTLSGGTQPPPPAPVTFAPALPGGTAGIAYAATFAAASGGSGSFTYTATGLPAGLSLAGRTVSGVPTAVGSHPVTLTATDTGTGATASAPLTLTIAPAAPAGNYTLKDEGQGKITAIGPDRSYLMVGNRKLIWGPDTWIVVNTPDGERHVIDSFVRVGMRAQWKGLRDRATNTVLTRRLEVN